jgi:hypothetical protein
MKHFFLELRHMLLISSLRYFICSILIISAGSNGATSCENDSNNDSCTVSVKANPHIVYTTYEDAEGRWTETSEREAEGSAVQSWDLVFEPKTPEDQLPDQPLEISFLPTLQLSADNEMPLGLIHSPFSTHGCCF